MLAIFAVAAGLMYARLVPALLAVPLMALGVAVVSGAGATGVETTIVDGTAKLAPVIVTVIFGALLSRVTLATGIAETIVSYAAEFGGDRPAVLALALCAAVALLFTSLTGLGAIVMVGSIVLPIMMTIGVPRKTAATLFLLAFALGFVFNVAQWTFYTKTFGVERAQMQPYALALAAIDCVALGAFAFARFRATRGYATWAVAADEPLARKRAPLHALVTPVLPIAFYFFLGASPVVAFALAAVYGVLAVAPKRAVATFVASAIRGVEDVAPAIVLFMGIGMLLVATGLPSVKAALAPLVGAIAPRSWFAYVVLFGLFSPLALYRGPLNPFGVGIAVYTVLAGLGALPAVTLVAAIMAVVQVQNVCDPTNTQNVWVANFTGVRVDEITRATLPFQVGVAVVATLAVALGGGALLGVQPFRLASAAAAAETTARSAATNTIAAIGARAGAADTIAVAPADRGLSVAAARAVYDRIARGWRGFRATLLDAAPPDAPCSERPYAALVVVSSTIPADPAQTTNAWETGVTLRDCAGWPVDEWWDASDRPERAPDDDALARAGLAAYFRMETWTLERPELARTLFDDGLAHRKGDAPTFLYTLFKTPDGQMRAFVRPGGPAYAAGFRTNDVIERIDGKFWWEYGTFQAQARAYDGLPHVYDIQRGAQKTPLTISLGAPFRP